MKKKKNKAVTLKNVLLLQSVVILYTVSSIAGKYASASEILSLRFVLFFGAELIILALYALLWQQMVKRIQLSVAYANRAMALLWSMVWAFIFFGEDVTPKNIIGVALVLLGTVVINSDDK